MKSCSFTIFISICFITILGCGTTKPYYPISSPNLAPEKARIVFTWERQMLGAAISPYIVVFNESKEPNGVIAIGEYLKNIPHAFKVKLFWFNQNSVSYLLKGPNDKKDSNLTNSKDGFVHGGIMVVCYGNENDYMTTKVNLPSGYLANNSSRFKFDFKTAKIAEISFDEYKNIVSNYFLKLRNKEFEFNTCQLEESKLRVPCYILPNDYDGIFDFGLLKNKSKQCNFGLVSTFEAGNLDWKNPKAYVDYYEMKFNIKVIGRISNGQTIVWDQDPGYVDLRLIDWSGGAENSNKLIVEAGKTYYVNFKFTFNESVFTLTKVE